MNSDVEFGGGIQVILWVYSDVCLWARIQAGLDLCVYL